MKHGELPKRPTVRIGRHFASEKRFNNSVTSIEYNLILLKFMHCFSCHENAVTSASAVQLLNFGEQLKNCQLMAVSCSIHGSRRMQPEPPTITKSNQPPCVSCEFEPANQSICVESIQSTEGSETPDASERVNRTVVCRDCYCQRSGYLSRIAFSEERV